MFYPEDRSSVEAQFRAWGLEPGAGASAIIAPHGAWGISGRLAANAFSAAGGTGGGAGGMAGSAGGMAGGKKSRDSISRVFILGPIYRGPEDGIFLSDSDTFETPLGALEVDRKMGNELASCSTLFEVNDIPHLREHSIEVLLPFIKYCFPRASIVPILMGGSRRPLIKALARALEIMTPVMKKSLCVVSCNVGMNSSPETARIQAEECIRLLMEKDAPGFSAGLSDGRISACGGALAASLLESGLVANREAHLVSNPLISARDEENKTVYYGALSYEAE